MSAEGRAVRCREAERRERRRWRATSGEVVEDPKEKTVAWKVAMVLLRAVSRFVEKRDGSSVVSCWMMSLLASSSSASGSSRTSCQRIFVRVVMDCRRWRIEAHQVEREVDVETRVGVLPRAWVRSVVRKGVAPFIIGVVTIVGDQIEGIAVGEDLVVWSSHMVSADLMIWVATEVNDETCDSSRDPICSLSVFRSDSTISMCVGVEKQD